MSRWSHLNEIFWSSLAVSLAWDPMTIDKREAALRWLGEVAAEPERGQHRRKIVRALEDGILQALETAREEGFTVEEFRGSVIRLFLPLLQGPLIEEMDDTLRRCLGYILGLPEQGRVSKVFTSRQEEEELFQLKVSEEEEEQIALTLVRGAAQGQPSPEIIFGPTWMRLTLVKEIPSLSKKIRIPVKIPLFHLVLADVPDVQPYLLDGLMQFFAVVDPRLADTLANLRSLLLSADSVSRKKALQELCCAYLSSFHFSFIRDLSHGLRRLGERPLTELDSLCGLAALREVPTLEDLLQAVLSADNSVISSIPASTRYSIFLLRINPHEAMNPLAGQVSSEIARLEAEGWSRQKILGDIAENACLAANVFEGLWSFLTLLLVEHYHSASSLEFGSRTWLVTDWVRAYVVSMLQARSSDERAASLNEPFMSLWQRNLEFRRRKAHAHTMRLAVWVTVSQQHLRELAAKVQVGDEVIGNWLIRSLLLADRLLPIITHELYDRPEEMQNRIEEIELELGVSINPELYPDLFNPFLYGPLEYDHAVAALLALLNLTWEHLTGTDKASPFWWSEAVRDALAMVAARPETEAETLLRTSRIQGKPNRLGVILDRTPQEIATEILSRGMGQLS